MGKEMNQGKWKMENKKGEKKVQEASTGSDFLLLLSWRPQGV